MNKAEILVIDDEPQIRKLLEITLESNDYKVRLAENGKEGIIQAANHPPDAILLDISLPDLSGHLVLKELRQWYNKTIIILSVQNSESDIVSTGCFFLMFLHNLCFIHVYRETIVISRFSAFIKMF